MTDWRNEALCRGFPSTWWFPEQGGQFRSALFVCSLCPSRDPCLEYALDENIGHGIWGGLTEAGRRSAKRNQSTKRKIASRSRPPEEQPRPADEHQMVV